MLMYRCKVFAMVAGESGRCRSATSHSGVPKPVHPLLQSGQDRLEGGPIVQPMGCFSPIQAAGQLSRARRTALALPGAPCKIVHSRHPLETQRFTKCAN